MGVRRTQTTLVCLPFAGAGAAFYQPWSGLVDGSPAIRPVQLPGRGRLIDEEPYTGVQEAVEGLLPELAGELAGAGPTALFGHSLGAVLGYELAHRLCAVPGVELVRFFASGSHPPQVSRPGRAAGLPDAEFLARVQEFAGYRDEALNDPELLELVLPSLRADVEMHESYRPSTDLPLHVPITAIRGRDDRLVGAADAAGWAGTTSAGFDMVELPGGHMYLIESAEPLLELICAAVE